MRLHDGSLPDVLLILEGVNDIAGDGWAPDGFGRSQPIVSDLQDDVTNAISSGVKFVFVSTILPVRLCPSESTFCQSGLSADDNMVQTANTSISQVNALIVGIPNAIVVDGYGAFMAADPTLVSLVAEDGLHMMPGGNMLLAQTFLAAIATHVPVTSVRGIRR